MWSTKRDESQRQLIQSLTTQLESITRQLDEERTENKLLRERLEKVYGMPSLIEEDTDESETETVEHQGKQAIPNTTDMAKMLMKNMGRVRVKLPGRHGRGNYGTNVS